MTILALLLLAIFAALFMPLFFFFGAFLLNIRDNPKTAIWLVVWALALLIAFTA